MEVTPRYKMLTLLTQGEGGRSADLPPILFLFPLTSGASDLLKNDLTLKLSQKYLIWDPL